ncbi:MAG: hypothetical protein ABW088_15400 [Sedimenticola sp.]
MSYNDIPDIFDFLTTSPQGRALRKQVEEEFSSRRVNHNRRVLIDFLKTPLNSDFLINKSHIPFLGCGTESSNEQALEHWAIEHLKNHPSQEEHLTSEFMVETLEFLKEVLRSIEEL